MDRTIKYATVKRLRDDEPRPAADHMANFISPHIFGRRLTTLESVTPYEFICTQWAIAPVRFTLNPIHQMPGRHI